MKKKKPKQVHWLWCAFDWLFPSFTELHLTIIFLIIATLLVSNPHEYGIAFTIFVPLVSVLLWLAIFAKFKLDFQTKELFITIYYAFVAILAGISLKNHAGLIDTLSPIERVNLFFISGLFIVTFIRFIFAWFLNDGKSSRMDAIISKGFDNQFRYSAHIVAAFITIVLVVALTHMYESTATVAILTFGYTNVLLSILHRLFRQHLL